MTGDAALHAAVISGLAVGAGFVVVFSILFTASLSNDGSDSPIMLGEEGQSIEIDFGVALERDIVVKKGEALRVPFTI